MNGGPLAATSVLDLTRLLPGGYCTLLLADLGADVVKVEEPGRGDYIRWTLPLVDGQSAAHRALNRGKRSVILNLKDPDGVRILHRLAERADVLVESFRPGVMDRLGAGFESLRAANPGLVYCAITGYGQDGPYRDRVGHDVNYIGQGGVLGITGPAGGPPVVPGVQIGDLAGGGMAAAIGILAALVERDRTGRGRFVDTAMLDGVVSWLTIHAGDFLATGEEPPRGGMRLSGGYACYRIYRCADGRYLTVGALEPKFWGALCEALGVPELVDVQYGPPERQREMAERLEAIFSGRSRDEWLETLSGLEVCVGPVNSLAEAFRDPQVVHRGMALETGPGSPFRFDGQQPQASRPAPGFGEHTAEVLTEIGVTEEELADLRARGVV
ncbi:MAG: CoA transferase [Actinomycetota bacterium]|nr:CoA transferase [Actinomycetota bacterium]